jgi:glycosyltransferase involved in cell wall biosynthesis
VRLSIYLAVDHAPTAPQVQELVAHCDRVIPSTRFGQLTLAEWIACDPPIPHGVDLAQFHPRSSEHRGAFRHSMFGLGDGAFLVGYFGRNSGHKRADLALRVFAHVVLGAMTRCVRCAHLTVHELDAVGAASIHATTCRACGHDDLDPEPARDMTMYMHTDVAYRRMWLEGGGSDLVLLAQRLGVTDNVRFADLARPDEGTTDDMLVDLMNACDVHLMLSEGAGWELTVLETAACGVPNIVTDHAAPAEYARPFSRLVPPVYFHLDDRGCRAIADLDLAAAALVDLHDDSDERAALARRGPEVARSYSWDRVGDQWHERLLAGDVA